MKVILTKAGTLNTGKNIFYKNQQTEISDDEFNNFPDDIKDCFTVIVEDKKDEAPADVEVKTQEDIEQEEKEETGAVAKAAIEGTPVLKTNNGKDVPSKFSVKTKGK